MQLLYQEETVSEAADLDASITHTAVGAARWSIQLTRAAPFHSHCDTTNVNRFIERSM